ncbi:MAG: site-2 protease family protein [Candidatus Woesearchaeota archaeon]|nr:site-2 protease family protein [Candidatus Woesearchaeota archaeon]
MNYDLIALLAFIFLLSLYIRKKRKNLELQKILYPVVYMLLYKTSIGIKLMNWIGKKYRKLIITIGYCFVGLGFCGLLAVSYSILSTMIRFVLSPGTTATGMYLLYPGTQIPGIGYLSFWYWLIGLFVTAAIHEFSHGIVAVAHKVRIKSSGFAILGIIAPIFPVAFVDPDEKELSKIQDVAQHSIFAAGPMINLILALIIFAILPYVADSTGTRLAPFEERITMPVGFSFDIINSTMPAGKAGLVTGALINKVGNESVKDANLFVERLYFCASPGENWSMGNENRTYAIETIKSPADNTRAYIGIENIRNVRVVKQEYRWFSGLFYWIKGLFKWIFTLNFFVGLSNLLPIFITDGSKMLLVALESNIRDKKKAVKVWKIINSVFLFAIIIGLLSSYIKKLF